MIKKLCLLVFLFFTSGVSFCFESDLKRIGYNNDDQPLVQKSLSVQDVQYPYVAIAYNKKKYNTKTKTPLCTQVKRFQFNPDTHNFCIDYTTELGVYKNNSLYAVPTPQAIALGTNNSIACIETVSNADSDDAIFYILAPDEKYRVSIGKTKYIGKLVSGYKVFLFDSAGNTEATANNIVHIFSKEGGNWAHSFMYLEKFNILKNLIYKDPLVIIPFKQGRFQIIDSSKHGNVGQGVVKSVLNYAQWVIGYKNDIREFSSELHKFSIENIENGSNINAPVQIFPFGINKFLLYLHNNNAENYQPIVYDADTQNKTFLNDSLGEILKSSKVHKAVCDENDNLKTLYLAQAVSGSVNTLKLMRCSLEKKENAIIKGETSVIYESENDFLVSDDCITFVNNTFYVISRNKENKNTLSVIHVGDEKCTRSHPLVYECGVVGDKPSLSIKVDKDVVLIEQADTTLPLAFLLPSAQSNFKVVEIPQYQSSDDWKDAELENKEANNQIAIQKQDELLKTLLPLQEIVADNDNQKAQKDIEVDAQQTMLKIAVPAAEKDEENDFDSGIWFVPSESLNDSLGNNSSIIEKSNEQDALGRGEDTVLRASINAPGMVELYNIDNINNPVPLENNNAHIDSLTENIIIIEANKDQLENSVGNEKPAGNDTNNDSNRENSSEQSKSVPLSNTGDPSEPQNNASHNNNDDVEKNEEVKPEDLVEKQQENDTNTQNIPDQSIDCNWPFEDMSLNPLSNLQEPISERFNSKTVHHNSLMNIVRSGLWSLATAPFSMAKMTFSLIGSFLSKIW